MPHSHTTAPSTRPALVPASSIAPRDIKPYAQEPVPGGGFAEMEVLILADLFNGRDAENWWDLGTLQIVCTTDPVHRVLDTINDFEAGFDDLDGKSTGINLAEDILDYAPLFSELADAYFDVETWTKAREVYQQLGSCETTSSVHVITRTAMCMRAMGDLTQAAEVFEAGKVLFRSAFEGSNYGPIMDSRRRRPPSADPSSVNPEDDPPHPPALINDKAKPPQPQTYSQIKRLSQPSPKAPKLSIAELPALKDNKERDARTGLPRHVPRSSGPETSPADAEQEEEENKMVDRPQLDLSTLLPNKHAALLMGSFAQPTEPRAQPASQRQTRVNARYEISDEFRGIKCDEWLELFFQSAGRLAPRNECTTRPKKFYDTCSFLESTARKCIKNNYACRNCLLRRPSNNEPSRPLAARSLAYPFHNIDVWNRAWDERDQRRRRVVQPRSRHVGKGAKEARELVWNEPMQRWRLPAVGKAAVGDEEQASEDEAMEVLLADKHPLMGTRASRFRNSSRSASRLLHRRRSRPARYVRPDDDALPKRDLLFRLLFLLLPFITRYRLPSPGDDMPSGVGSTDPLIALSLGAASLSRASQQQCDNWHQLVAQATAFLDKYRQCRKAGPGDGYGRESEIE
ncbi:TPR-like protein [Mycena chlorophos]|uniref:TPR-like protein n=1 Tax=Mycena chlorophos TaxID=658473 RepID=A0A8H6S0P6_MYCCL|nr:TPR-like protein [Mycena chlorophos]